MGGDSNGKPCFSHTPVEDNVKRMYCFMYSFRRLCKTNALLRIIMEDVMSEIMPGTEAGFRLVAMFEYEQAARI